MDKNFILIIDKIVLTLSVYWFYMEVWGHDYANYGGMAPIKGVYFVFAYGLFRIAINNSIFIRLTKKGFFWWLFFYFTIVSLYYLLVQIGMMDRYSYFVQDVYDKSITSLGLGLSLMALLTDESNFKYTLRIMIIAVCAGCVVNFLDLFDFSDKWGGYVIRSSGYYMNPNSSGRALSLGFIATMFFINRKYLLPYYLLYFVGTFLTLSRGSIPILFLVGFYLIYIGAINLKGILIAFVLVLILGSIIWQVIKTNENTARIVEMIEKNESVQNRISTFFKPAETNFDEGVRGKVAKEHFEFYLKSPILGNGLSSSRYAQKNYTTTNHASHVMYIHLLNEFGLLGLVIFFGLPFSLFVYNGSIHLLPELILFTLLYLIAGLATHTLYDLRNLVFCYAIYANISEYNFKATAK